MMYWAGKDDLATRLTFNTFLPYFHNGTLPTLVKVSLGESFITIVDLPSTGIGNLSDKVSFTLPVNLTGYSTGLHNFDVSLSYGYENENGGFQSIGYDDLVTVPKLIVNRQDSPFGSGWGIEGLDKLHFVGGGIILEQGVGNAYFFNTGTGGSHTRPAGEEGFSEVTESGGQDPIYTLKDKYGNVTVFDGSGMLKYREDPNGNRTTYDYDSDGYTEIVDPFKGTTTFDYDAASHKLSSITDFAGRTTTLHVEGGQLRLITMPADAAGYQAQTLFNYGASTAGGDVEGFLKEARKLDVSVVVDAVPAADVRGHSTTIAYDDAYGVQTITKHDLSQPIVNEYRGSQPARYYTQGGLGTVDEPASFAAIDVEKEQSTFSLDEAIFSSSGSAGKPFAKEQGVQVSYRSDYFGNPNEELGGPNGTVTYVRNEEGLPTIVTSADPDGPSGPGVGMTTIYTYDNKGNVLTETQRAAGGSNALLSKQIWEYDPAYSRVTRHVDELGRDSRYAIGGPTDSIGKRANILSTTQIVGLNDSQSTEHNDITVTQTFTTATTPVYSSTGVYAPAGLVELETDALGRVTKFQYDVHGQVTRKISNFGAPTQADVEYDYNAQLLRNSMTDELGRTTTWTYDNVGNLLSLTEPDPDGTTGPLTSPVTSYEYDKRGNQVRVTDPLGNVTRTIYNIHNRVLYEIAPPAVTNSGTASIIDNGHPTAFTATGWSTGPAGGYLGTTLKKSGGTSGTAQWTMTVPDANKHYELLVSFPAGATNTAGAKYNVRDVNGALIESFTVDQKVAPRDDSSAGVKWHSLGVFTGNTTYKIELDSGSSTTGDVVADATRFVEATTKYTYGPGGLLLSATDELERTTVYTYDSTNRRISVTQPDPDGPSGPLPAPITKTEYYADGSVKKEIDALGNATLYEYDDRGQMIRTTGPDPDGPAGRFQAPVTEYFYNAAGETTAVKDPLGRITRYEYDKLGRRTAVISCVGDPNASVYDQTIDESGATRTPNDNGIWIPSSGGLNNDNWYHNAGSTSDKVEWSFSGLTGNKEYAVLVTWKVYTDATGNSLNAADAQYELDFASAPDQTVFVDQRRLPGDETDSSGNPWHRLVVLKPGASSFTVRLKGNANARVVADAVRLVEVGADNHELQRGGQSGASG